MRRQLAFVIAGALVVASLAAGFACGGDGEDNGESGSDDGGQQPGGGTSSGRATSVDALSCPVPSHAWPASSAGPRVFFTDLTSGPVTGGEQNLGAFVTLYGEGFGGSRGDSKVAISGREVARYVVWGENNAFARGIDMVVVQLGPEAKSGDLVVTVGSKASAGVPFKVREGSIFFVDPGAAGADDANPGSAEAPFASIWAPRRVMKAGDIAYIKGGHFADFDAGASGWDANLFLSAGSAASGKADAPVAYIGYPGDGPSIGSTAARRGVLLNQDDGPMDYYVLANLTFTGVGSALPLSGTGHRVVGSCFFDGGEDDSGMIGVNGEASGIQVLGNLLVRNGAAGEKLHHAFYIGGFGKNTDIELGYNHFENHEGGRAVQVFGHVSGDEVDNVVIHDNYFLGSELNNITLGGSDANGASILGRVEVFNNVIAGAGAEGLRINDSRGTFVVRHNTIAGNSGAQLFVERAGSKAVTFENNLVVAGPGQSYVAFETGGASPTSIVASYSLCFGAGPCDSWMSASKTGDPRFAGPADYSLSAGSAAIDAGTATSVGRDFAGVARPAGSAPDIGAFERP